MASFLTLRFYGLCVNEIHLALILDTPYAGDAAS